MSWKPAWFRNPWGRKGKPQPKPAKEPKWQPPPREPESITAPPRPHAISRAICVRFKGGETVEALALKFWPLTVEQVQDALRWGLRTRRKHE